MARRPASFGAARTCRDRLAPAEAKREQLGVGRGGVVSAAWVKGRGRFHILKQKVKGGPRCSNLSPLLPLPRIHTTRGCFGEARNDPRHHGHAHWLAEQGLFVGMHIFAVNHRPDRFCSPLPRWILEGSPRVVHAGRAGLVPGHRRLPVQPLGLWRGRQKLCSGTCGLGAHKQCSRGVAWASVEIA